MFRKIAMPRFFLVFIISLGFYAQGFAQITWTGLGDTFSWSDASNWDSGLPSATDNVIISNSAFVLIDISNAVCQDITITGGATLYVGFSGFPAGTLSARNITIDPTSAPFPPPATVKGTLILSNGLATLNVSQAIDDSGDFIIEDNTIVNYNGDNSQTILPVNYYNLGISGNKTSAVVTLASGTIDVANTFTYSATGSPSFTTTGNTFNYSSASSQSIVAIDYNILSNSGGGDRVFSSGTVNIAGSFTKGAGACTFNSGSIVDYNGSVSQIINALNYQSLIVSGARGSNTITFDPGTIGITTSFLYTATGTPTLVTNSNTFDYNGTSSVTVGAFNYNNLTISGVKSGVITFESGGTIDVANDFSHTATGSHTHTTTGNTFNYSRGDVTTIAAIEYNNLTNSGNGGRTLPSGTVSVAGTFSSGSGDYSVNASNTFDYAGSGSQNIASIDYNNLTNTGGGARVLPSETVNIAGVFTPGAGAYTITGNTINFNSASSQTIPAFNYNNLTSSSTGSRILASTGTIGVAGIFTKGTNTFTVTGSTINYSSASSQTIMVFDYNNLTNSGNGARVLPIGTVSVAGAFTSGAGTYSVNASNVFDYSGSGSQNIASINYNDLTNSGNGARVLPSGTVNIAGVFTPGAGAYTITGNTINYNSASPQTISAFNYNNLSSSSTGSRTLASSGTIGIAGAFTKGTNSYTVTGSTVNYTSASSQTITTFDYNDLSNSGNGDRTLPSGTVSVAGTFTSGSGAYTVNASNTFDYSGAGSQTIAAIDYNSLNNSGNGDRTLPSGTVAVANTFTPGSGTYTVNASNIFEYNGSVAQTINDIQYNDLLLSGAGTKSAGSSLTIGGDWTNNSTWSRGSTNVIFGSTGQIAGSATSEFNDMTISSGTVTVTSVVDLYGTLTLGASTTFNAKGSGGDFTITSTNGSSNARVAAIPASSSITGNLTVQRYYDGAGDAWRNIGAPVSGATTADLQSVFNISVYAGNGLAYYDETNLGTVDDGWVLESAFSGYPASSTLSTTLGYSMWTNAAYTGGSPVEFTGALNQGDQNMGVTYSSTGAPVDDGWNLVANPYASTIDWDLLSKANLNGTVYVWNTAGSRYDAWNGSTGSLTDGYIASGQGFWVQSNATSPSLVISEVDKAGASTSFLRTGPLTNHLSISLSQGEYLDKTYIHFRDDASDDFDNQTDGLKLSNGIYNLSSLAQSGESLIINSLSTLDCSKTVDLNITNSWSGEYSFNFSDINSFASTYEINLKDSYLNQSTLISEGSIYTFSISDDSLSFGDSRFSIEWITKPVVETLDYQVTQSCVGITTISINNGLVGAEYNLLQNDVNVLNTIADGSTLSFELSSDQLTNGENVFDLNIVMNNCSVGLLPSAVVFDYSGIEIVPVAIVSDGLTCGKGNQVTLGASGAVNEGFYNWYETLTSTDPIPNESSAVFLTPALDYSREYYVSIINEFGCESSERTKVVAEVVVAETPSIVHDENNNFIIVAGTTGSISWYKDGILLEGISSSLIADPDPGEYYIVSSTASCEFTSNNLRIDVVAGLADRPNVDINIYPNPSNGNLNIDFTSFNYKSGNYTIMDTRGKVLLSDALSMKLNKVDITSLPNAPYIINIVFDEHSFSKRFIKN